MTTGLQSGDKSGHVSSDACGVMAADHPAGLGLIRLFLTDKDGFTTVSVALALLLALTLVFSAAAAGWVIGRTTEIQRVADATALAGENVVAGFSTIAQVLDACVLSLGLVGITAYGAGLVASCVPGLSSVGVQLCDTAGHVLHARQSMAHQGLEGLNRLEQAVPLLIVANSASCASGNSFGTAPYVGCALPFPAQSQSDYASLATEVTDQGMGDLSQRMQEISDRAQEAKERADDACERAWRADCVMEPRCLWERAQTLAGLSDAVNPHYPRVDDWNFGVPLLRARAYYQSRFNAQTLTGRSGEELTDAACRRAFYEYALQQMDEGSVTTEPDGTVRVDLRELPHDVPTTRATTLYTESVWPCTEEGGIRTLHSTLDCPGAQGTPAGTASLADIDAGVVARCEVCRMDVTALGRVAAASTSIDNGFEHYWRIIVESAREYEQACKELVEADRESRKLAEEGKTRFQKALEQLAVPRSKLCPPGAWGTIAVVCRGGGEVVPTELTASFISSAELSAGAAVSAAVLAPDPATSGNNVLARFLDHFSKDGPLVGGALDGIMELWGSILLSYGSGFTAVSNHASSFLDRVDGVLGGSVGSWLKQQISDIIRAVGLEPADMRLRKPIITSTRNVLQKAGNNADSTIRSFIQALPNHGSPEEFAQAVGDWAWQRLGGKTFTIAELKIPSTSIRIPLTVSIPSRKEGQP